MNFPGTSLQTLTEKLVATKEGAIGWIIFNNPERHNAVSLEMWQSLPLVLNAFSADPEVRVIVLRGAGEKAFVSGADISQFKEKRSSAEAVKIYNATSDAASEALRNCPKPTIAMIRGYCIGGGTATAVNCDIRIAAEDARFGVPAAKLGLGYRFSGINRLATLVGPQFAAEIVAVAPRRLARGGHHLVGECDAAVGLLDLVTAHWQHHLSTERDVGRANDVVTALPRLDRRISRIAGELGAADRC